MTIKDLQPAAIWNYFYDITQIPRPSKKEEKSFWNWLLPLILLGILSWYFWKVFEKQNQKEEIKIEKQK